MGAKLTDAYPIAASLVDADLSSADIRHTQLLAADLSGAICVDTAFVSVDLSTVKGLEQVRHLGPSSLGIGTIYKSRGNIPSEFLRGCGLPDNLIDRIPSLLAPVQFDSCIVSYSQKDEEFAQRVHARLRDAHVPVWLSPEELKARWKNHERRTELRYIDKLLVVLSKQSMASEWVESEIAEAYNRTGLLAIRLVSPGKIERWRAVNTISGRDVAEVIRKREVLDFSNWKDHDSFETEFKKLLDALKKERIAAVEGE